MSYEKLDRELVSRARCGDRSAFSALIARQYPLLLRTCHRALSDADLARDAAQEAVLIAMLGLERLRDDKRFGAWLIGIGLNVCRAMVKPRERRSMSLQALSDDGRFPEPAAPGPDPEWQAENGEFAVRIRAAIASLPAGQREAVTLFYLAGLTHAEIAEELDTQPGAVKTRAAQGPRVATCAVDPTMEGVLRAVQSNRALGADADRQGRGEPPAPRPQ